MECDLQKRPTGLKDKKNILVLIAKNCIHWLLLLNRELMLEMVVYAERVPKISKGDMWRESEVLRWEV